MIGVPLFRNIVSVRLAHVIVSSPLLLLYSIPRTCIFYKYVVIQQLDVDERNSQKKGVWTYGSMTPDTYIFMYIHVDTSGV